MRTQRLVTWLMLSAIAVPQTALSAWRPLTDAPSRSAVSAGELASVRGGSIPAAKIGASSQYGTVGIYRNIGGTRFCGVPSTSSAAILPGSGNHPQCNASVPVHSFVDDSVDVLIGGMAAVVHGNQNPSIFVYVNGVNVPAAQLGDTFTSQCPFDGNAFAEGATLDRYNCGSLNFAQIPVTYFHGGLNTVTIYYRLVEAAFADYGSDTETRMVMMQ